MENERTLFVSWCCALAVVAIALAVFATNAMASADEPDTAYSQEKTFHKVTDEIVSMKVFAEAANKATAEKQPDVQAEQEPESVEENHDEECFYDGEYYYDESDGYYYGYDEYGNPFRTDGVAYNENGEFTWYSQRQLNGSGLTELNENGRHVDEATGFVMDGDGYIALASPYGVDPVGTVIETPFGQGKVYDVNIGDSYDVYTDF